MPSTRGEGTYTQCIQYVCIYINAWVAIAERSFKRSVEQLLISLFSHAAFSDFPEVL